jgi:hypothetical protein
VHNIDRAVFIAPHPSCDDMAVMEEFDEERKKYGVSQVQMKAVTKNYAFDQEGVPRGKDQKFIKVKYPGNRTLFTTSILTALRALTSE